MSKSGRYTRDPALLLRLLKKTEGILVVHDFIHNQFEVGCRFAYKDFINQVGPYTGLENTWAWWVKNA